MSTRTVTESRKAAETRRALAEQGAVSVRVDGGCMEPLLPRGRRVTVLAARAFREGDVALIDARGTLLLHRLVGRVGRRFLHRGDSPSPLGVAGPGDLLGVVAGVPRRVPGPRTRAVTLAWRLGDALHAAGVRAGLLRRLLPPRLMEA